MPYIHPSTFIFSKIEYDPRENSRGVVTADEWNTILTLLKDQGNYAAGCLQTIVGDLYTKIELSSTTIGADGASLIGVDSIPGVAGTNVREVFVALKEQLVQTLLGQILPGTITSVELSDNLNFTGDTLTFNNDVILTTDAISSVLSEASTDLQVPGAEAVFDLLAGKQDVITANVGIPTDVTPGNIYLQYIV